jgi:hypothetical protein
MTAARFAGDVEAGRAAGHSPHRLARGSCSPSRSAARVDRDVDRLLLLRDRIRDHASSPELRRVSIDQPEVGERRGIPAFEGSLALAMFVAPVERARIPRNSPAFRAMPVFRSPGASGFGGPSSPPLSRRPPSAIVSSACFFSSSGGVFRIALEDRLQVVAHRTRSPSPPSARAPPSGLVR